MRRFGLIVTAILLSFATLSNYNKLQPIKTQTIQRQGTSIFLDLPQTYNITTKIPDYQSYTEIVAQIKEWEQEAPDIVKVGTYGKSSRNKYLYYIRVNNGENKPKVLITACIHGNEPHSTSTVMAFIGTLLHDYGRDDAITDLIDTRDIYFIPVVSPDSYPFSREVDGVDPNRNFPTPKDPNKRSVPPIKAIQSFFKEIRPNAVISGHTWGRVYLTPWGYKNRLSPNENDYQRIIGEMTRLSGYEMKRACQMYGHPIHGIEADWYYRNGAFAIVVEFGVHQHIPNYGEIKEELSRTYKSLLYFIKEAPLVEITSAN